MKDQTNNLLESARSSFEQKEYDKAITLYNKIIRLDPSHIEASYFLGLSLFSKGQALESLPHLKKASSANNNSQWTFNYGSVLLEIGHYSEALKIFNSLLSQMPNHIPTIINIIGILGQMGQISTAKKLCSKAIQLEPANSNIINNFANLCKDQGEITEALTYYKKAISISPNDNTVSSNFLLACNYRTLDQHSVFELHREWEKRMREDSTPSQRKTIRESTSPIKIGYVSADFRIHSVGYFIEPLIEHHDKKKFHIYCYHDCSIVDSTTERIKNHAHVWRPIYNISDQEVISMINADGIDILVDLAGHSSRNRLTLFLQKPAPIQISYLGYPNTTGLSTMDFRITDALADPEDQDQFYTEKLIRLSRCFLCYRPPDLDSNIPPASPFKQNGYITFGSFNNLPKVSEETISVWAAILRNVPNSKLVIKSKPFNDPHVIHQFKSQFVKHNIEPDQLLFMGHSYNLEEHLNCYNLIDISLDTFPYNGTTTTCEALFMGRPVITLKGDRHGGRVGYSILNQIGCTDLITPNVEEYIGTAKNLAKNASTLESYHNTLKKSFTQSQLCNARSHSEAIEHSYQLIMQS